MQELKVNVTGESGIVEVRTGAALPLREPLKLNLVGIITTVGDFVDKRKETFKAESANVVANYTNRTITLTINESNYYCDTVTGKLELYPELAKLRINENHTYTEKELLQRINFYGRWFKDKDAHAALLNKLQNFRAKVEKEFVNSDDFKGTSAVSKLSKIEHDIPLSFELHIPVFSGQQPLSFLVDICVSARDGGISFWFESKELHELASKSLDEIFEKELTRLADYVIVKTW